MKQRRIEDLLPRGAVNYGRRRIYRRTRFMMILEILMIMLLIAAAWMA